MRWHPKARSLAYRIEGGVGFVDSAREENNARAVIEIYLNRVRYPLWAYTLSIPLIENRACYEGRVGFVDSAREENNARAVIDIYLNRGRYPL